MKEQQFIKDLTIEEFKALVKEIYLELASEQIEKPTSKVNRETEINPSAFYKPRDAHKLIGSSQRYLDRMAVTGDIDYEINKRTGHRMYKGIELIKFRNNNPIK